MLALVIILTVAVGALALLVGGLLRSHADIVRALHGLGVTEEALTGGGAAPVAVKPPPIDAAAVDLIGVTPRGGAAKVGVVGTSHQTLLAFLSGDCGACSGFWAAMRSDDFELPGLQARVVVVTKGPDQESAAAVADLASPNLPVVMSSQGFADYGVPATPYFVLVDGPTGKITGEGAALTWSQLGGLARRAAGGRPRRDYHSRIHDTDAELAAAGISPGDPQLFVGGSP